MLRTIVASDSRTSSSKLDFQKRRVSSIFKKEGEPINRPSSKTLRRRSDASLIHLCLGV